MATGRAVYLFRPGDTASQPLLASLLTAERTVKAGIALAYDLKSLAAMFAFDARNVLDLGGVARRHGYGQTGLRNLAGLFLDARIPKGAKTSNWATAQLTQQQIAYAATDAWACRELFLRFETLGFLDD